MTYNKLKVGQAFMFEPNSAVFVRVRGGFRPGKGGPLYAAVGTETVYLWGG